MADKDGHDPGWNDPPLFTYDKAKAIQAAAGTKKGNTLNKRVAFPISGNLDDKKSTPVTNSPLGGPPTKPPSMMQTSTPPPVTSQVKSDEQEKQKSDEKIPPKDRLQEVLQNFQVDTKLDDEIAKRIKIMEKMWIEDKLDETIQSRIFELSEALSKGDAETADNIQKSLMVDYISQCSSWMSGIRHLINKKRQGDS